MKIKKIIDEQFALLYLSGEFDTVYVPKLLGEISSLIEGGIHQIILDLRLVEFMNSTALGALLKAQKQVKESNGELVISRPSVFCKELITRVGLDRLIPVFTTEEAALEHLDSSEKPGDRTKGKSSRPIPAELEDESSILLAFTDDAKHETVGGHAVGRIRNIQNDSIEFTWNASKTGLDKSALTDLLSSGTSIRLKFRIPLFKKEFFENVATVRSAKIETDRTTAIQMHFGEMTAEDSQAIQQFLEDVQYLKKELKRATETG